MVQSGFLQPTNHPDGDFCGPRKPHTMCGENEREP